MSDSTDQVAEKCQRCAGYGWLNAYRETDGCDQYEFDRCPDCVDSKVPS